MQNFLNNILNFPTVLYTGLLALVVLYWLSAIFGLAEFDTIETDIDTNVSSANSTNSVATWLTRFKLDGIPFTLSLSIIIFISWIVCFFAVEYFVATIDIEWVRVTVGFWSIVLAPALAIPLTSIFLSPLKPLLSTINKRSKVLTASDLVGNIAIIRSEKVNPSYGSVDYHDGGAGLILQVRADEPNDHQRGDSVMLRKYHSETNTYTL